MQRWRRTIEDIDDKIIVFKRDTAYPGTEENGGVRVPIQTRPCPGGGLRIDFRQKRKELHLKVADSIEKVFRERLHEFYGMLAYHYSKGEDKEKAEEYLIKAGEKALRTSASAEALNYFKAALELYQSMYWKNTDCEKVVMIKKNIALAFLCQR